MILFYVGDVGNILLKNSNIAYAVVIASNDELILFNSWLLKGKTSDLYLELLNESMVSTVLKYENFKIMNFDTYKFFEHLNWDCNQNKYVKLPILDPVDGNVLPEINQTVWIHLNSMNDWYPHKVVGYYVWNDLGKNEFLHRVFVRVEDENGVPNSRILRDVRLIKPSGNTSISK